jgi:hypothetical protein
VNEIQVPSTQVMIVTPHSASIAFTVGLLDLTTASHHQVFIHANRPIDPTIDHFLTEHCAITHSYARQSAISPRRHGS